MFVSRPGAASAEEKLSSLQRLSDIINGWDGPAVSVAAFHSQSSPLIQRRTMSKTLKVRVSRSKPESMTKQITNQIANLIQAGTLAAGDLLPSERTLADSLGVARNVVRRSYEYLSSGGHIEGGGRQGRRVSSAGKSGKGAAATQKSSTAKRKSSNGSAKSRSKSSRKAR
jgi:DNA-binding transcriptional regulator YhcF (GntR family)